MNTPPIVTLYDEYGLDAPLPPEIQATLDAEEFETDISDADFWD